MVRVIPDVGSTVVSSFKYESVAWFWHRLLRFLCSQIPRPWHCSLTPILLFSMLIYPPTTTYTTEIYVIPVAQVSLSRGVYVSHWIR